MKVKRKVRIKDIAEKAGVSVGTVDRVLHERGEVAKSTRDKVLKIADEYSYKPNLIARALTSKKQLLFASLLPQPDELNTFWNKHLSGIDQAIEELEQFQVNVKEFFFNIYDDADYIAKSKEILKLNPDGVIFAPIFNSEAYDFAKRLEIQNIPFVLIDSNLEGIDSLGFIGEDAYQSGRVAAQLIDYGVDSMKDVLVVNFTKNLKNSTHLHHRYQGFSGYFLDRGKNKGLKISVEIPNVDDEIVDFYLDKVFTNSHNIGGIFITGSKVHVVARYLEKKNIVDIALVGYDMIEQNLHYLEKGIVSFLVGHRPVEQGHKGIKRLFDHIMQHQEFPKIEHLPVDIVNRENFELYLNS